VDYGFEAFRWNKSRLRIIQQYNLSDEELKAVAALKKQIEATENALKICPAEPLVATRSRRQSSTKRRGYLTRWSLDLAPNFGYQREQPEDRDSPTPIFIPTKVRSAPIEIKQSLVPLKE
jgi:hypothetical protein